VANGASVAFVASGGLSHFVVDEEIDQLVLSGLQNKDAEQLSGFDNGERTLPGFP
jgi:hypothetical protein